MTLRKQFLPRGECRNRARQIRQGHACWGSRFREGRACLAPCPARDSIKADSLRTAVRIVDGQLSERGMDNAVIIHGKEATKADLEKNPSNTIKAIEILKEGAAAGYGEKGKNGVVLITTKNGRVSADSSAVSETGDRLNGRASTPFSGDTAIVRHDFKEALILIEGEQVSASELHALSPDKIKHMTVLKDKEATEKYGDKGKNGVMEVELKKEN